MLNVLFVCLGNICRSPMAEGLFKERVEKEGLSDKIHIESRGLGHWQQGNPIHKGTKLYLEKHHIDTSHMKSTLISLKDFKVYDMIIGMDQSNIKTLKKIAPKKYRDKIHLFLDIHPELTNKDVPDPYYDGRFEVTYELIMKSMDLWMERFINALNLEK